MEEISEYKLRWARITSQRLSQLAIDMAAGGTPPDFENKIDWKETQAHLEALAKSISDYAKALEDEEMASKL